MQIIKYNKITDEIYDYSIKFNPTRKTVYYFNKFAQILGNYEQKKYDPENKVWLIKQETFDKFLQLDESLFSKKTTNNKYRNIIKPTTFSVSNYNSIGNTMKLSPFEYQKKAIKLALDKQNAIIVAPCGAGKTPIGIGIYLEAFNRKVITNPGMIIVKASLKRQWLMEVNKFSNLKAKIIYTSSEASRVLKSTIRHKKKELKKEQDLLKQQELNQLIDKLSNVDDSFSYQFEEKVDLYILNYETLLNNQVLSKLKSTKLDFVYADEIHYVKNDTAKRAEALYNFNNVKLRFGATATPIQRDPRDIFGLFKFIKPDLFPKKSQFNRFYVKWGGYGRVIGSLNEESLNKHISPYMINISQDEIGKQLPEVVVSQRYCDFTFEQQEAHDRIMYQLDELHEKEKMLQQNPVDNKEELFKVESNILMYQTFAQELADTESLLINSDSPIAKKYVTNTESNKMNLLLDLLEEILESGEKVCIFSRFTKMQDIIIKRVTKAKSDVFKNIEIAYINGSLNADARYNEVYNKFRDNADCKILCCSDAGAEGINLSWCKYMIEVDLANSYAIQQQRHGRLKRADSNFNTVFVYQLICRDSYDEIAQKIVNKKEYYDKAIIGGQLDTK